MPPARQFENVVRPFRDVYDDVTRAIRSHRVYAAGPAHTWIQTLVQEFEHEYRFWNVEPEYRRYRNLCATRLRSPVLRLAAFAYLHICYDLPRVIAKNWPPPHAELDSERAYFELTPIFFDTFGKSAKRWSVVGVWRLFSAPVPSSALSTLAIWALHLRTAAWIHARRLGGPSAGRPPHQPKIMRALTVSLINVLRKPWSVGIVSPPHRAFGAAATLGGSVSAALDHWWTGAAVVLFAWLVYWLWLQRRHGLPAFVEQLSESASKYVGLAVHDPKEFELEIEEFSRELAALEELDEQL